MRRALEPLVLSEVELVEFPALAGRRKTAQAVALRARIVLLASDEASNKDMAARLEVDPITDDADIVASAVANHALPEHPDFEDYGEVLLRAGDLSGFVRVDWFTPDGLPTWGDGRLTLLGTEGYIELRKYVDVAGRPGTDHVFLSNRHGTSHIDASGEQLTYFRRFLADVRDRTETAMTQRHVFTVSRLALEAQAQAARLAGR